MSDNPNFVISIPKKVFRISHLVSVGVLSVVAIPYITTALNQLNRDASIVPLMIISLVMVYILIAYNICLVALIWKDPLKELSWGGKINGLIDGLTSWGLNSLIAGIFFGLIMGLFLGPAIFVVPVAFSLIIGLLLGIATGVPAEFRDTAANKER